MRRLTRNTQGVANRWARGVAFMWVLLIGFPLMFFGLAMAVDFTRVIMADRQMATAAHAAALAGAYQFNPGKATINAAAARSAAIETLCASSEQGATDLAVPGSRGLTTCPLGGGSVAATVAVVDTTAVRVTATYSVENLLLLSYFEGDNPERRVSRTAAICDPRDATGATGGYCTRPSS